MSSEIPALTRALAFAAHAHANQRRKGAAQEPYINHLIEVLDLLVATAGVADIDVLIAGLLHDTVEDGGATDDGLAEAFGRRVAAIVAENTDDMTLPKNERRRRRIAAMATKSVEARIVKMADVISNLRGVGASPPAGWGRERKLGYLEGCRQVIDAARGTNAEIEALFDRTAAEVEHAIREEAQFEVEGRAEALRQLDSTIGEPVHLVYLLNTSNRPITGEDADRLAAIIGRTFPSATIQRADAIAEGVRRPILISRIRSDSTEAIVALAQRLCLDFDQRFVGVEVGGRYIRIYADDTA